MLDGVVVDSLTQSFLDLANDSNLREEMHQSLRGYFHDARNRLNLIKMGLYIARKAGCEDQSSLWRELDLSYQGLELFVERIQTLCRPAESERSLTNLGKCLEARGPLWNTWFANQGRQLSWSPPSTQLSGWFDSVGLIQGLDALLMSRAVMGRPGDPAMIRWSGDRSHFFLEVLEEAAMLSEPLEGRECRSLSMAIPLLARAMVVEGGTLSAADRGGLSIRLTWPIRAVPRQEDRRLARL